MFRRLLTNLRCLPGHCEVSPILWCISIPGLWKYTEMCIYQPLQPYPSTLEYVSTFLYPLPLPIYLSNQIINVIVININLSDCSCKSCTVIIITTTFICLHSCEAGRSVTALSLRRYCSFSCHWMEGFCGPMCASKVVFSVNKSEWLLRILR